MATPRREDVADPRDTKGDTSAAVGVGGGSPLSCARPTLATPNSPNANVPTRIQHLMYNSLTGASLVATNHQTLRVRHQPGPALIAVAAAQRENARRTCPAKRTWFA